MLVYDNDLHPGIILKTDETPSLVRCLHNAAAKRYFIFKCMESKDVCKMKTNHKNRKMKEMCALIESTDRVKSVTVTVG